MTSYLQNWKSYQPQILHQECFYGYDDSCKVSFQSVMLTLIFGIWASEPPLGPGEQLKRPGLIGLIGRTVRAREKLNFGHGKNIRNQSNNASAGMRNYYSQISRFWVTDFVNRTTRVSLFGVEEGREGKIETSATPGYVNCFRYPL